MLPYQDAVTVNDGVQPVGDGEHSTLSELLSDGSLDQFICPTDENNHVQFRKAFKSSRTLFPN